MSTQDNSKSFAATLLYAPGTATTSLTQFRVQGPRVHQPQTLDPEFSVLSWFENSDVGHHINTISFVLCKYPLLDGLIRFIMVLRESHGLWPGGLEDARL